LSERGVALMQREDLNQCPGDGRLQAHGASDQVQGADLQPRPDVSRLTWVSRPNISGLSVHSVGLAEERLPGNGVGLIATPTLWSFRMADAKTLDDLFHDTLKDVYFAEKKILSALPKMSKAAQNDDLRAAFEKHQGETEGQIERLEKVFAEIDQKPQTKTCDAILGIIKEGEEIMKEYKGSPAHDAGLLAAAQAVEHYEISRYGTLLAWANELGLEASADLLKETLDEEEATDEALSELAEDVINQEAQDEEEEETA
jgi:ferritin-like metal-binding protein YciE